MRYSWQLLVVMALVLSALGSYNNAAAEQPAATAISTTTTIQPPTTTTPTPATPTPTKPPPSTSQPTELNPPGEPGSGGEQTPPKANKETSHEVAPGESLWTIAQNHLAAVGSGGERAPARWPPTGRGSRRPTGTGCGRVSGVKC